MGILIAEESRLKKAEGGLLYILQRGNGPKRVKRRSGGRARMVKQGAEAAGMQRAEWLLDSKRDPPYQES